MTQTPLDVFLSDQALATARDLAQGGTPTIAILPAGGTCTWCECDLTARAHDFCAGCPRDASMALHIYSAATGERDGEILLCSEHKEDALQFLTVVIAAGGFQ